MLCLDTSSLTADQQGEEGADVELIDQALLDRIGVLSPVTVAELLSDLDLSQTLPLKLRTLEPLWSSPRSISLSQYRIVSSYPAMTCIPLRGFPRWWKTFTLLKLRRSMIRANAFTGRISSRHQGCHETLAIRAMTLPVNGNISCILVQSTASRYGLPAYR